MTSEPMGERVAKLETTVEAHDEEIHGEHGIRSRLHGLANKVTVLEGSIEKLNWKISTFVGLLVIVGQKLLDHFIK